jgi:hypothetical protein
MAASSQPLEFYGELWKPGRIRHSKAQERDKHLFEFVRSVYKWLCLGLVLCELSTQNASDTQ